MSPLRRELLTGWIVTFNRFSLWPSSANDGFCNTPEGVDPGWLFRFEGGMRSVLGDPVTISKTKDCLSATPSQSTDTKIVPWVPVDIASNFPCNSILLLTPISCGSLHFASCRDSSRVFPSLNAFARKLGLYCNVIIGFRNGTGPVLITLNLILIEPPTPTTGGVRRSLTISSRSDGVLGDCGTPRIVAGCEEAIV